MLGTRIRGLRKARDLTQVELSEKAGIKQQTLSLVETGGIADPGTSTIKAIADALDVDMDYLLGRERFVDKKFPPQIFSLADIYERIPPDEREQAFRVARSVFESFWDVDERAIG